MVQNGSNTATVASPSNLRKGKWTTEEERYAQAIISMFNRGLLPIAAGTTLRCYLSEKLSCDPMRITKKFAGASCIGKQVFMPAGDFKSSVNQSELARLEQDLRRLQETFENKLALRSSQIGAVSPVATPRPPTVGVRSTSRKPVPNTMKPVRSTASGPRTVSHGAYSDYDDEFETQMNASYKYNSLHSRHKTELPKADDEHNIQQVSQAPSRPDTQPIFVDSRLDPVTAAKQLALKKSLKRSYSTLSIIECDGLVANSGAATELFLSFVTKMSIEINSSIEAAQHQQYQQRLLLLQKQRRQHFLAQQEQRSSEDSNDDKDTESCEEEEQQEGALETPNKQIKLERDIVPVVSPSTSVKSNPTSIDSNKVVRTPFQQSFSVLVSPDSRAQVSSTESSPRDSPVSETSSLSHSISKERVKDLGDNSENVLFLTPAAC